MSGKSTPTIFPPQREVADLIGFENYLKLIDVYAAETIYIPKRDSFERIARNQRIVEEYNGDNLKALAKKYNLTTVTVRAIVDEKHREIRARPLDGQMSFFPPERKVKILKCLIWPILNREYHWL